MTSEEELPPETFDALARELSGRLRGKVRQNEPIARLTSFRVGGPAAILVEPADTADLSALGEALDIARVDVFVLGRGTNVLVSDHGYPGVVVRLGKGFDWIAERQGSRVEAGGATALPQVANKAAKLGLSGLEFAIAIPATVGGAVRMNAGAHASAVAQVLHSVTVCRLPGGAIDVLETAELGLEYRSSVLGTGDVVCSAMFDLEPGDRKEIAAHMERYRDHRTQTQPVDAPNAGSMFKNPEGDTAGRLIEQAGMKGLTVGNAQVSDKHGNFFLAHPGATAQQIYDLMATVQHSVAEEYGVLLIPEVRPLGFFESAEKLVVEVLH